MDVKLKDFIIKKLPEMKFIGKEIRCKMDHPEGNPIPDFWMKCFGDGTFKVLDVPERIFKNAMIGWCGNFDSNDNTFLYIVGGFVQKTFPVPEGFTKIDINEKDFACGTLSGKEPAIYYKAYDLTNGEAKKRNINVNSGYAIEWYDERYDPESEEKTIDLLIPVI